MQLVFSSNQRAIRAGQIIPVPQRGGEFEVVGIKKPTTKAPQGEIALKSSDGRRSSISPRDINAEWIA